MQLNKQNTTVFVHDTNNLARAVFGVFLTKQVVAGQFNRESTLLALSYVEGVNIYDTMGIRKSKQRNKKNKQTNKVAGKKREE